MPFGTPDEVRREVRSMARTMGRGGGYILQTSHTVLEDVPLANLVAFIEEVQHLRDGA
jgi:uroporphyrinogen decarboxylase